MGELVETAKIGTATSSFAEELLPPLIQHPCLVDGGNTPVFLGICRVLKIATANLIDEVLCAARISGTELALGKSIIYLRPSKLYIVDVLKIFSFALGINRVTHKADTRVGLAPTRRHHRLQGSTNRRRARELAYLIRIVQIHAITVGISFENLSSAPIGFHEAFEEDAGVVAVLPSVVAFTDILVVKALIDSTQPVVIRRVKETFGALRIP